MENKPVGLKRSVDFQNIQKFGKKRILNPWLFVAYIPNSQKTLRVGCTISRKIGSAVIRNRLRRWIKEFFRRAAKNGNNPEFDINLVFKARDVEFYKTLRHEELDSALEGIFKFLR